LSDPVDFDVAASADLAVSVYFPSTTGPITWHQLGVQTTYISTPGDFTAAAAMPVATTATSRFVLADVEVAAAKKMGAFVTLGDSKPGGGRCRRHRDQGYGRTGPQRGDGCDR
jgi:hypothetical protein